MVVEISWTEEWHPIYEELVTEFSAACEGFCC